MAILKDAYLSVNGVDLSSYLRDATFTHGSETVDDTAMGDNTRSAANSLETISFSATLHQAFASAGPDQTLNGLVGGAAVTIIYGPGGATASTTNPHYSFSGVVTEYNPGSGTVGDQMVCTFSAVAAGDISRVTS